MKLEDLNPTDGGCRSFISIIFPKLSTLTIMLQNTLVSILYKYHISRKMKAKRMFEKLGVSILYKYHISLSFLNTVLISICMCVDPL